MTAPPVVAPDPLAALPPLARWLLGRCAPEPEALALVTPSMTIEALYHGWMEHKHHASAIRLIAAVLPARESIWWAWVSARHAMQMVGGRAPTAAQHATMGHIERWIVRPDEPTRRTVWTSALPAGLTTPVGMVATAVFLSGVSVAPEDAPVVPPPPGATVPIIAGAILIAATQQSQPEAIEPTTVAFATQGLEVVKRLGGWDAATKAAHERHTHAEAEYATATARATATATTATRS